MQVIVLIGTWAVAVDNTVNCILSHIYTSYICVILFVTQPLIGRPVCFLQLPSRLSVSVYLICIRLSMFNIDATLFFTFNFYSKGLLNDR